jgi:microcystin-dependent protein
MLPYTGATAPNSAFVLPFGQAISRTTYATYFSLVGTTFGTGDGSSTFNIIDMRGRLPIGQDNMGGSAASRVTTAGSGIDGTTIGANGGAQTLTAANIPSVGGLVRYNQDSIAAGTGAAKTFVTQIISNGLQTSDNTSIATTAGNAQNKMPPGIVVPYILRVI